MSAGAGASPRRDPAGSGRLVNDDLELLEFGDKARNTAFDGWLGFTEDDVRWCVTVPAIWDDADKQFMRRAAGDAGFPDGSERLLLVQEPEAAAVECVVSAGILVTGEEAAEVFDSVVEPILE